MIERLSYFLEKGHVEFVDGKSTVQIKDKQFMFMLNYVGNMTQAVIDTYLIVLIAIYQIVGRNLVLKEKTLIKELHHTFQQLYE